MGRSPQVYLKPGDTVELGIEGLGVQRQKVVAGPRCSGPRACRPQGSESRPSLVSFWKAS